MHRNNHKNNMSSQQTWGLIYSLIELIRSLPKTWNSNTLNYFTNFHLHKSHLTIIKTISLYFILHKNCPYNISTITLYYISIKSKTKIDVTATLYKTVHAQNWISCSSVETESHSDWDWTCLFLVLCVLFLYCSVYKCEEIIMRFDFPLLACH